MTSIHSDAFVFFGAAGDLAFKQIFPALQAMIRHGHLNMPIIGVARSAKRPQAQMTNVSGCITAGSLLMSSPGREAEK